jgi:transposase
VSEHFRCVNCGFSADAGHVGAVNVLVRAHPNSGQSMVARCFAATS